MSVIKFILKNLDEYKQRFWLSLAAGFIESFASISIPLLLAASTVSGLSHKAFLALAMWLLVSIAVTLGSSWYIRRYGESVAFQFPNHLRLKYFRELERLPIDQLAKNHTGYVLSMVNQIGSRMSPILMDIFWTFTGIFANVGLLIYFTATKSLGLTFLNLALFLTFVVVSTFLAQKMTNLADTKNRQDAVFSQYFVDFMSNLTTIKRLGIRRFADTKLTERSEDSNAQIQKFQNAHSNRWLLLHSIYYAANFITIGYLLYEISKGTMPVSLLILFVSFYGNLRSIIERLAENIITFTETRVYINNLSELLAANTTYDPHRSSLNDWKKIVLKNVAYSHTDNTAVIRIPSLTIKRGDAICIYGTSGEGKTTALNLLTNYLPIKEGERNVDDVNYRDLGRTWFADQSAFISQETELFNLSIKDNMTLGQDIQESLLWQLLADLRLADWVKGLENGLETVVGEKGLRLSAGQKQRVNLARGILLSRPLYLLDEPTSHLDEATEQAIIKVIEKYLGDKTIVVVTHRPAIKKICNKFYKMSGHTIALE